MAITLKNRTFVLACALLLAAPGISSLLVDFGEISNTEARKLAGLPGLEEAKADPWNYTHKVDLYLNDHFGLRPQLLQLNRWARQASRTPASPDVVVGREGWLFYAPGLVTRIPDLEPYSLRRIRAQADMLQTMSDRITAGGARFAVMIAPDKHTIYPEQLPWWLEGHGQPRAFDQFVLELGERGVAVVDPRERLVAGKADLPTYQRTDTHWTPVGATIAFNQLMELLSLPPVRPKEPFVLRDLEGPPFDLTRKALMHESPADFRIRPFVLPDGKPKITELRISNDPGREAYEAQRPGAGETWVIMGDSFSKGSFRDLSLVPAQRLIWIPHRNCGFDWQTIEKMRADVVLYEIVERNLGCNPGAAAAIAKVVKSESGS